MRARAAGLAMLVAIDWGAAAAQQPPAARPESVAEPAPAYRLEAAPQPNPAPLPQPAPEPAPAMLVDDDRPPVRPETPAAAPPPTRAPDPASAEAPDASGARGPAPADVPEPVPSPDLSPLSLGGDLSLPTAAPLALAPAGEAAPAAPSMPETLRESDADFAACLQGLDRLGVTYAEIAAITDPAARDCGIARPLQIATLPGGVALAGGAPMRCEAALALAEWTHSFVTPSARHLPDAPRLTGLQLGSTYDCRGRVGTGADIPKMSEHALGNAIDIMAFTFDAGVPLVVTPRAETGDMAEAFQRAVRGSACLFFTTVLGPGANEAHADHLHLDIAARKGGWRLCE